MASGKRIHNRAQTINREFIQDAVFHGWEGSDLEKKAREWLDEQGYSMCSICQHLTFEHLTAFMGSEHRFICGMKESDESTLCPDKETAENAEKFQRAASRMRASARKAEQSFKAFDHAVSKVKRIDTAKAIERDKKRRLADKPDADNELAGSW